MQATIFKWEMDTMDNNKMAIMVLNLYNNLQRQMSQQGIIQESHFYPNHTTYKDMIDKVLKLVTYRANIDINYTDANRAC